MNETAELSAKGELLNPESHYVRPYLINNLFIIPNCPNLSFTHERVYTIC